MKRTLLPLNALRVFDAAARHLSFTRAADELAVTPAAVGQQIRALEDVLGVVLFRRTPKGLELTPEASSGLAALRDGFLQFEDAVRAMRAGQGSQVLTLAAPRDLTVRWLMPRLSAFRAANPDMRLALLAADQPLDFAEANVDLGLWLASSAEPHVGTALAPAGMVSIVPPGLADAGAGLPVICWGMGGVHDSQAAHRVADAGQAIDAVAAGWGRTQVPQLLAQGDIDAGRVTAVAQAEHPLAYHLLAPLPQWRQKKVQALVAALTG